MGGSSRSHSRSQSYDNTNSRYYPHSEPVPILAHIDLLNNAIPPSPVSNPTSNSAGSTHSVVIDFQPPLPPPPPLPQQQQQQQQQHHHYYRYQNIPPAPPAGYLGRKDLSPHVSSPPTPTPLHFDSVPMSFGPTLPTPPLNAYQPRHQIPSQIPLSSRAIQSLPAVPPAPSEISRPESSGSACYSDSDSDDVDSEQEAAIVARAVRAASVRGSVSSLAGSGKVKLVSLQKSASPTPSHRQKPGLRIFVPDAGAAAPDSTKSAFDVIPGPPFDPDTRSAADQLAPLQTISKPKLSGRHSHSHMIAPGTPVSAAVSTKPSSIASSSASSGHRRSRTVGSAMPHTAPATNGLFTRSPKRFSTDAREQAAYVFADSQGQPIAIPKSMAAAAQDNVVTAGRSGIPNRRGSGNSRRSSAASSGIVSSVALTVPITRRPQSRSSASMAGSSVSGSSYISDAQMHRIPSRENVPIVIAPRMSHPTLNKAPTHPASAQHHSRAQSTPMATAQMSMRTAPALTIPPPSPVLHSSTPPLSSPTSPISMSGFGGRPSRRRRPSLQLRIPAGLTSPTGPATAISPTGAMSPASPARSIQSFRPVVSPMPNSPTTDEPLVRSLFAPTNISYAAATAGCLSPRSPIHIEPVQFEMYRRMQEEAERKVVGGLPQTAPLVKTKPFSPVTPQGNFAISPAASLPAPHLPYDDDPPRRSGPLPLSTLGTIHGETGSATAATEAAAWAAAQAETDAIAKALATRQQPQAGISSAFCVSPASVKAFTFGKDDETNRKLDPFSRLAILMKKQESLREEELKIRLEIQEHRQKQIPKIDSPTAVSDNAVGLPRAKSIKSTSGKAESEMTATEKTGMKPEARATGRPSVTGTGSSSGRSDKSTGWASSLFSLGLSSRPVPTVGLEGNDGDSDSDMDHDAYQSDFSTFLSAIFSPVVVHRRTRARFLRSLPSEAPVPPVSSPAKLRTAVREHYGVPGSRTKDMIVSVILPFLSIVQVEREVRNREAAVSALRRRTQRRTMVERIERLERGMNVKNEGYVTDRTSGCECVDDGKRPLDRSVRLDGDV